MKNKCTKFRNYRPYTAKSLGTWKMFDNPTDNHTDIEVPLYYELRFTKLKSNLLHQIKLIYIYVYIYIDSDSDSDGQIGISQCLTFIINLIIWSYQRDLRYEKWLSNKTFLSNMWYFMRTHITQITNWQYNSIPKQLEKHMYILSIVTVFKTPVAPFTNMD